MKPQTEVLEKPKLPDGWRWVKLKEHVSKIGSGITPFGGHASYLKSGIPLIRSQNIHMNRFEKNGLAFISNEQDEEMKGTRVQEGDVLLNITGASIGRTCIVPSEICPANVNQHVSIIRCKDSLDPQFLVFYIFNPFFQKFIMDIQSGATRQALTKVLIENFDISLPPLSEQKRIAEKIKELLQEIERARTACEKELEAVKSLPNAYLREVFENEESKKWEKKIFVDCIDKERKIKILKGLPQKDYKKTGKYPIIDQGYKLICGYTDDQSRLYGGELPVIIFGDHTRIFKYIDFSFAVGADGTKIIRPNKNNILPKYFFFALMNLRIKELGYSRHFKLLRNAMIPIPPMKIQQRIVTELEEKISQAEKLKESIEKQLITLNLLPQAVLSKAFKGTM